jgi:glycosyltransferase involved in cell wall biosynthesis
MPDFRLRFSELSTRFIISPSAKRKRMASQPGRGAARRNLVSAIIPARNEEESIARAVESVARQNEIGEVIVVDDESTDGTSAILQQLAERIPKLKVLKSGGPPEGWTGKNYAVTMGAQAATGEWLLFTDADTEHLAGATRRALTDAEERDAVMVSYSPEQEMETWWERALTPVVYWRLSKHYSYARVNDARQPDAAANGQFLMIRRDAYEAVGGHAKVRGKILEDVALAREVKRARFGIFFWPGYGLVRTRMYRSFAAMWQGWTKNLYPLIGGTRGSLLLEIADVLPVFELGVLALLWWQLASRYRISALWLALLFLAALLGRQLAYAIELRRNRYPAAYIQYFAAGLCLYVAALCASWWKSAHGGVVWKGRAYRVRT